LNKFILKTLSPILLAGHISAAPIVDIEDIRRSGEVGSFKDLSFALSGSRGNENRDNIDLSLSFVNNNLNSEKLFVYEKSERTKDNLIEDESSFMHARILWKNTDKPFNLETYFQNSENPFQRYKKREIYGFGLRFSDLKKLKLGVSLLNENEESLSGIRKKTDRINLYLFKEIINNNDSLLSFTTFVQPSINEISDDYKYTFSASYKILISEKFSIKFKLSESYDSDPPDSAEESDQAFITSFSYSF
tara:strand:+ start:347 stop:1090 length:744 start_codon:yes stop_codon:yes gene_type:complete